MTKLFVWLAFMSALVEDWIASLFHAYEKPDISEDVYSGEPVELKIHQLGYVAGEPWGRSSKLAEDETLIIDDESMVADVIFQHSIADTQPVKARRYTAEQIKPKWHPDEKPSKHEGNAYWFLDNYLERWVVGKAINMHIYGVYDIGRGNWFIDVPDAPESLKPVRQDEIEPLFPGKYMAHLKDKDIWQVCTYYTDVWMEVDYYIRYQLD